MPESCSVPSATPPDVRQQEAEVTRAPSGAGVFSQVSGYVRAQNDDHRAERKRPMILAANGFTDGLDKAWSDTAEFIPKIVGFLAILVIGYFVAKIIARIADAALERAGFDRAVERGGIKKALAKSQYDASTLVSKVVFYTVFLLVLEMAFGV